MKKTKKVLRKAKKVVAPAVELTREAAREVFAQLQAAHKASTKAIRKRLPS